ncbi:uncharacterized protein SPPG_05428 [Spizellomyces punctatus DAOM BR117]|uniref:Uncharacterized protein n=1 Tax=Spizellomyces punctatus (strain DAOM BR117) TaxID=645134 RepID=A0A0L0HDX6_SPIPD|nr:uncharacterized protein SPPG_05428 [Spizellomyces punctatus DAOM BR117]KNC99174.1 hypothetical protein SPPG_05428 [Spizellomyces punctatus DAOM BR117]|eukprot:XP_016607214.1 hypothetical protein SPPG_05428 [Spizellomyces punctatus DAOM BR117]
MKEATLRTEAELMAKEVKLERDAVQRRYDEALAQLSQLQNLKEKYSEKLQESMAQYKIDTNREYSNLVSSVEIEKAKLEAERAMLREKTSAVEKMSAQVQRAQQDMDDIQDQLKEARAQALRWRQEKEEAEHTVKDLSLQVFLVW